ncbi:hypothetical protein AcW1_001108 [Taiwanofungus camphoratus]|nr:hypothetical protein AcW1_001108 [Antrodia cinnamomea]
MQRMLYGKDTSLSVVQDRARAQLAPWSSLGDNSPRLDRRLCSASVRLSAVPALGNGLCARIWGSTSAQRYTNHVVGLERRIGSTMQLHPRTRFGKWCHSVSPCMCGAACVSLRSWPCDALETTDVICFHLHNAPSCTI